MWIVVFGNGLGFFVARHVLGRVGRWEGPVLLPSILLSVGAAVAMVAAGAFRLRGPRLGSVAAVPFAAAVGLGLWATTTTAWSLEPAETWWRGLLYTLLPCLAWVIADLSGGEFRRALAFGAGFVVVGGLFLVAVGVDPATDRNGDWQGFMTNPNGFAPLCALALLAGISLAAEGARRGGGVLASLAAVGLVGSAGRTAGVALIVALTAATLLVGARRAHLRRSLRSPRVVAGIVSAVGVGGIGVFLARAWNEPTLGQRREIWRLVGDHVADAPLIGQGWGAFWRHPALHDDPLLQRGSAHGSVPDLLLGGGVVALVLWSVVVIGALIGTARRAWSSPDNEAWLWLAVVLFLLLENITESFVLWFSYNWIVLTAAALRFGATDRSRRLRAPLTGPAPASSADRLTLPSRAGPGSARRRSRRREAPTTGR